MCSILVWKDAHPRWPLVIAANRDEFEGRASTGPQLLSAEPVVIGGRDEIAGGTWLGISDRGFVTAVANRRGAGEHDQSKRSRGTLVLETARANDVTAARDFIAAIDPFAYNPFSLLVAGARAGFVAHAGGRGLNVVELPPGAHAITNWDLDFTQTPKAARALQICSGTHIAGPDNPDELARQFHDVLRDHAEGSGGLDGGLCVHRPAIDYGTRSSWIVLLGATIGDTFLYYIEGHPCEGELSDVTRLLRGFAVQRAEA